MTKRPYDNFLHTLELADAHNTPAAQRSVWQNLLVAKDDLERARAESNRRTIEWFFTAHQNPFPKGKGR
jgi:hypothetical protein